MDVTAKRAIPIFAAHASGFWFADRRVDHTDRYSAKYYYRYLSGRDRIPPFGMFDFAPVGVGVALAGLIFISLVGWRLTPMREGKGASEELFQIEDYISEVIVPEDSKIVGRPYTTWC
jgi:hypothetical protein